MSTAEEASPFDAAPVDVSPQTGEDASNAADDAPATSDEAGTDYALPPRDTLSPAVRRLVRQFDLDITGVQGSGPEGRIRVGDVMGLLTGRTDTGNRDAPPRLGDTPLAAAAEAAPEIDAAPQPPRQLDTSMPPRNRRGSSTHPAQQPLAPPRRRRPSSSATSRACCRTASACGAKMRSC
jgi:pyruvate/2-oxoglutarate dehydrogenase complex dihydrolipoamide acyltransferase (E2) component